MTEDLPETTAPDYSEQRDQVLNEILYFFPVLHGPRYVTERPKDPNLFPKIGTIPVYDGRRAAIDRDHVAPNAGIAAAVLKNPIAVFVEIFEAPGTDEIATIETFVGVVPVSGRARRLAAIRTNQGVVAEVAIATGESNAANWTILKDVRGIPAFSVPFP